MFRSQRIQLLELGAYSVKAVAAAISRGGRISIEALRAVPIAAAPGAEAYAAALAPVVAELATGFLRRNLPVHLVPGASLVRGTVHHLPPVTEEAVPEILRTSRLHFVGSFGTRGPIHDRSFALQVTRENEQARVTAVHGYARRADVVLLKQAIESAGLKPGAILPPALALSELAAALATAPLEMKPRVLVDVGATSTAVLVMDEAGVHGYRRVFGGVEDGFRRLVDDLPETAPELLAQMREAYLARGREGLDAQAREAGLAPEAAAVIAEQVAAARERLLTAVFHAVVVLTRPPVASGDEEDEGAPPPEDPRMPGPVALIGGGAQLEDLVEVFQSRFDVPCFAVDVPQVLGMTPPPKATDVAPSYACALGAAAVLARMGDQADLADDPQPLAAFANDDEGFRAPWAVRPLIAGAVLAGLAVAGFLTAGRVLEARVAEMQKALDDEKASLPPAEDVRKVLVAFRNHRAREVGIDARFAYVGELLRGRFAWTALLRDVDKVVAPGACVLSAVELRTAWPDAPDGARGPRNRQRVTSLALKGESPDIAAINAMASALKTSGLMRDPRVRPTRLPSGGDPKAPGYQFEIAGDIDASHDR